MVQQEMSRVYGQDNIAAVVMVHDTAALDAAAAQYCQLQEQFEDVLDWYQSRLPPAAAADVEAPSDQQQQHAGDSSSAGDAAKGLKEGLKRKTVSSSSAAAAEIVRASWNSTHCHEPAATAFAALSHALSHAAWCKWQIAAGKQAS
jgi:hypothetical protein